MNMTLKFILYSSPFALLFFGLTIFEPWIYRNLITSTKLDKIKKKEFEIIAHKGASGLYPENTMISFQKALEMKVDMIELDVRQTKDEQVIVFHDQTIDRTTNGTGDAHNYTLDEIKQFNAGSWFDSKYSDQKIPTLKEVLDLIHGQCKVLIEIKHMDHPNYLNFSDKVIDIIKEEENGFDWCILQSYEDKYLEEAVKYDQRIKTRKLLIGEDAAPLLAYYIETRRHLSHSSGSQNENGLMALIPEWKTLSPRRVFRIHARGYKVFTYSVNEREDMIKMLNMGVDGIITDYPDRLIQIKKELNVKMI